jgi:hypothetical protein
VDPARLAAVCEELTALLGADDARAPGVLRENAGLLRAAFGTRFEAIDAAVRTFAFDVALGALLEARAALARQGPAG